MTGEIKNSVTLDVSGFVSALDKAERGLVKFETKLGESKKVVDGVDKNFDVMSKSIANSVKSFGTIDSAIADLAKRVGLLGTANSSLSASSSKTSKSIDEVTKSAKKSNETLSSMAEFTKTYGSQLKNLNPLIAEVTQSQKKYDAEMAKSATSNVAATEKQIKSRIQALAKERQTNEDMVESRKKMAAELTEIEKKATERQAAANATASRYFGKNSAKGDALREVAALAAAEAKAASDQNTQVKAAIAALEAKNALITKEIGLSREVVDLTAQKVAADKKLAAAEKDVAEQKIKQAAADKKAAREQAIADKDAESATKKLAAEKAKAAKVAASAASAAIKDAEKVAKAEAKASADALAAWEKDLAKRAKADAKAAATAIAEAEKAANAQAKAAARATAIVEKEASKRANAEIREAERMKNAITGVYGDMAKMWMAAKMQQGVAAGVSDIEAGQNVESRMHFMGYDKTQNDYFDKQSEQLTKDAPFMSINEAKDTRLNAISAVGKNDPRIIDATIKQAAQTAFVLKSSGLEHNDLSAITKNLYGLAEARQVMGDPDKVNATFDVARRMQTVSQGKISMADIESTMRTLGPMRSSITDEGLMGLLPLMEQFKTAGGGNGGGGGAQSVGTLLKMSGLYAQGKPITNRAAENFMGANILNEGAFKSDAAERFKDTAGVQEVFMKSVKSAGFKNSDQLSQDPVKYFGALRGQILDFMMQDKNFSKFFSGDKFSYKDGKAINKDGSAMSLENQDKNEKAAFQKFFAISGMSNKSVDGMVTMTDRGFIERSEHVREQAKHVEDLDKTMKEIEGNWSTVKAELKSSFVDLAVAFEPILRKFSEMIPVISGWIRSFAGFTKDHPVIAAVTLLTGGLVALRLPMMLIGALVPRLLPGFAALAGGTTAAGAAAGASVGLWARLLAMFPTFAVPILALGNALKGVGGLLLSGFARALPGTAALMSAFGGTLVKWLFKMTSAVGWGTLALMAGWAIGTWVKDLDAGGVTVSDRVSNLISNMVTMFQNMWVNIRLGWQNGLAALGRDTAAAQAKLRLEKDQNNKTNDMVNHVSTEEELGNASKNVANIKKRLADSIESKQRQNKISRTFGITPSSETTTFIEEMRAELTAAQKTEKEVQGRSAASRTAAATTAQDKEYLAKKEADALAASKAAGHLSTDTADLKPPKFEIADTAAAKAAAKAAKDAARQHREFENPFAIKLAQFKSSSETAALEAKDALRDDNGASYDDLARIKLEGMWGAGELNVGKDKNKRMFKNKDGSLNWTMKDPETGKSMNDAKDQYAQGLKNDDLKNWNLFVKERQTGATTDMDNALQSAQDAKSTKARSRTDVLESEFARRASTTHQNLGEANKDRANEQLALTKSATGEYAQSAAEIIQQNKQSFIDFADTEDARRKATAELAYELEKKKMDATVASLDKQIAAMEQAGDKTSDAYLKATETKAKYAEDFNLRLKNMEEERARAQETAFQKQMRDWKDLGSKVEQMTADWATKFADRLGGAVVGEGKITKKEAYGFVGGMASDFAKASVKKTLSTAWSGGEDGKGGIKGAILASDTLKSWTENLGKSLGDMGGWFSKLGEASDGTTKSMWQLAADGIGKAISALATWVASLLASSATGGGDGGLLGTVLKLGVTAAGAYSGGGGAGDLTGAAGLANTGAYIPSVELANGGAFDGGMKAFANGAAFTNGIYDSPQLFKFANGGSFGVMGEAGPEAVMPLTRDGGGRLGVTVHGGSGGGDGVQINITVNKDGSSSSDSSGSKASDWKGMAEQMKKLVIQEMVNQKRPGGILTK